VFSPPDQHASILRARPQCSARWFKVTGLRSVFVVFGFSMGDAPNSCYHPLGGSFRLDLFPSFCLFRVWRREVALGRPNIPRSPRERSFGKSTFCPGDSFSRGRVSLFLKTLAHARLFKYSGPLSPAPPYEGSLSWISPLSLRSHHFPLVALETTSYIPLSLSHIRVPLLNVSPQFCPLPGWVGPPDRLAVPAVLQLRFRRGAHVVRKMVFFPRIS